MKFLLRFAAGVLTIPLVLGLAACSAEPTWHPVTTEESQALAATRFHNFNAGTREFTATVTVQGGELQVDGWYDFVAHGGYASLHGNDEAELTLLWADGILAVREQNNGEGGLPALPVPDPVDTGWTARTLDPSQSALDALLLAFELLGSDRPDNPLLLQQSGALWLGTETIETDEGPIEAELFAGPPSDQPLTEADEAPTPEAASVKYALNETGLLLRTDLNLGGTWSSIHFDIETAESIDDAIAWLRQAVLESTGSTAGPNE